MKFKEWLEIWKVNIFAKCKTSDLICFTTISDPKQPWCVVLSEYSGSHYSNVFYWAYFCFLHGILNPHMHKMGPRGLKNYIFGDHFLHFNGRKHMISSFYLKWVKFSRNCEFVPIQFGSLGTHNWNKIHNYLWIRSTSGKMMVSYNIK